MFHDPLNLPPVGTIGPDRVGTVISTISNMMRQSRQVMQPHIDRAQVNALIRKWGKETQPTSKEVISNHILDDIDVITDQQTKEPAVITYECYDDGTPPVFFLKANPTTPLTEQQYDAATQPSGAVNPATGQPAAPMFSEDEFIRIDSREVSKFYQKQAEWYWKKGRVDARIRYAVLSANTLGFTFPIYEWNPVKKCPRLWVDVSVRQCFPDPIPWIFEDCNYFVVEFIRDAREAQTMFPRFADAIEEVSRRTVPTPIDFNTDAGDNTPTLGQNLNHTHAVPMVTLRVVWIKDQPCPMTPDEAQQAGLVEYRPIVPAPLPGPDYDPDSIDPALPAVDTSGQGTDLLTGGGAEQNDGHGDGGFGVLPGAGGGDPAGAAVADPTGGAGGVATAPPAPQGLFSVATGNPIDPPARDATTGATVLHGDWPMKLVTRQMVIIQGQPTETAHDRIVQDIECPYCDIPAAHTCGVLNLFELWGMGIPEKLESLQRGRNQILTAIVEHSNYHRFPVWVMPQSVRDSLPDNFKKYGGSLAGQMIYVRDELYTRLGGKILSTVAPEPVQATMMQVLEIMAGELDQRASHPQIAEGTPPAGVTGHQSIELLQAAANTKFSFAAQNHRDMIQRIAYIHCHAVIDFTSIDDVLTVDKSYPPPVAQFVQQWARNAQWEVTVEDVTGTSISKRQKQQDAYQKFAVRDPQTNQPLISLQTLSERTNEDYEREAQRWMEETQPFRDAAALAAQQQAAAAGDKGGGGEEEQQQEQPAEQAGG